MTLYKVIISTAIYHCNKIKSEQWLNVLQFCYRCSGNFKWIFWSYIMIPLCQKSIRAVNIVEQFQSSLISDCFQGYNLVDELICHCISVIQQAISLLILSMTLESPRTYSRQNSCIALNYFFLRLCFEILLKQKTIIYSITKLKCHRSWPSAHHGWLSVAAQ